MSFTFTLTGTESMMSSDFYPSIVLDEREEYQLGLIEFESWHSIPNIDATNNKFVYYDPDFPIVDSTRQTIEIPKGAYEITNINDYLAAELKKVNRIIKISANNNTLRTEIKSDVIIDIGAKDSVGALLGFRKGRSVLSANSVAKSDFTARILKINAIRVKCNIVSGSYLNGQPEHTLFQFYPQEEPGYKISITPSNVIYLPINRRVIDNVTITIVDQDDRLVDFNGEPISVRLHLKRL